MYRTTTPTESGWYWVESSDWTMAYLNAEVDPPRLRCFDKDGWSAEYVREDTGRWQSKSGFSFRLSAWIGPIPSPSDEQKAWVAALVKAGCEVYVWRPGDWDEVVAVLGRRLAEKRGN
jgi:hypothetical protein